MVNYSKVKHIVESFERSPLDVTIESILLYTFVAFELLFRMSQTFPRVFHNTKNLLKFEDKRVRYRSEFRKLLYAHLVCMVFLLVVMGVFKRIANFFQISFLDLSFTVVSIVPGALHKVLHRVHLRDRDARNLRLRFEELGRHDPVGVHLPRNGPAACPRDLISSPGCSK